MTGAKRDPADEKLSLSVVNALWRSEPLRALDLDSVQVVASGGTVVLRGLVASDAHRYAAEQLARGVPGVAAVIDELVTDIDLERRVAMALASENATRKQRIAVRVAGGVASLYGAVPAAEAAERARAVALSVPGLVGVESKLQVVPPGVPAILAWQQSVEGRPLRLPAPAPEGEAPVLEGEAPAEPPAQEGSASSPPVPGPEGAAS
ncbi:MAG: BON domain-containing protein [Chloroflexota bacterium]